jgi:exonuclease III
LGIDIEIEGEKITLINIFGPNNDTPLFYNKDSETIDYFNNQSIILTGDYNLAQNQWLDTYNYVGIINPKAKDKVLDMIEIYNLTDPLRELYPDLKRHTWRKRTPLKQTRLDFFLISQSCNHQVHDVKIMNSYRSDHCPIILQLKLNDFILGRGLWKFKNSLLYEMDYAEIVKETIKKKLENSMLH